MTRFELRAGWSIEWWGFDTQSWNWGWSHRFARGIDFGPVRIVQYHKVEN